ncbi:MAG: hypothetical protein ACOCX2_12440, partial [Armatimonadota bacterium]
AAESETQADVEPETEVAQPVAQEPPPEEAAEPEVVIPAADLPDGELTLDDVQQHWPRVGEALDALGHPAVAAIISGATPHAVENGTVILGFARQFECKRAIDSYNDQIAEAVERVFGRPVDFACRLQEATTDTRNQEEAADGGSADAEMDASKQQETVLRLLNEFDGTEETPG